MNKKGALFMAFVIAGMIFMAGMLLIPFFQDGVTDFRTNLQCSTNSSISDGAKLTCLAGDAVLPYFIWAIISLAGGIIFNEL